MTFTLNYSNDDVNVLSKKTVFKGFFTMNRYEVEHKLFDGSMSRVMQREMFERGHAVAVLPYDPDTQEFVLIEQFRLGAMETCESPWLIEVIAGMIDEGESPEEVCHREAKEESNIEMSELTKALTYLSSPGGTTERLHIFMGKTDSTKAGGVFGLASESEDIKVHRVPEATARAWLETGRIDNAAAIIALQWFFLNKATLLASWR
ncbi:ADP-ribose diphosphatase [Glaciecola sp. MH2013]|uniref:ADP-ribose diphosphatase n=1 Tax=Glaciecola sp. MH2013 TaxID=2785524 RepID=UPI00189EB18F|nr:ADP-ribose diphosphatase [Glaciecola sp. MH2013]MBF7071881.1 ADP-ribose diphosphatase [Glaciecola sp. MH2013]